MICIFASYSSGDEIQNGKRDGTFGMHGREDNFMQGFGGGPEETDRMEELGKVEEMLKPIIKIYELEYGLDSSDMDWGHWWDLVNSRMNCRFS